MDSTLPNNNPFASFFKTLFFLALLILAFLGVYLIASPVEIHTTQPVNKAGGYAHALPEVEIRVHGWNKHNTEAKLAELTCAFYGVSQVRFQPKTGHFFLLCVDMEGNVFVQIIEKIRELFYEQKTAFRYVNQTTGEPMTWNEVMKYLDNFTTRWTKPFP